MLPNQLWLMYSAFLGREHYYLGSGVCACVLHDQLTLTHSNQVMSYHVMVIFCSLQVMSYSIMISPPNRMIYIVMYAHNHRSSISIASDYHPIVADR